MFYLEVELDIGWIREHKLYETFEQAHKAREDALRRSTVFNARIGSDIKKHAAGAYNVEK